RAEAPRRPGRGGHVVTAGWTPPGPAMLFCPADRPERYGKAAERADVVIVDLEDAVAPENRTVARDALRASELDPARTIVRVNPADSADHAADLEALAATGYRCVTLAKTESAAQVTDLYSTTGAAGAPAPGSPSPPRRSAGGRWTRCTSTSPTRRVSAPRRSTPSRSDSWPPPVSTRPRWPPSDRRTRPTTTRSPGPAVSWTRPGATRASSSWTAA